MHIAASTPKRKEPVRAHTDGYKKGGGRSSARCITELGCVDTIIMCRFLSRISAQTRRENAGGLSPDKFFRRSMRKILPKRCILGLVSTRPTTNLNFFAVIIPQHFAHFNDRFSHFHARFFPGECRFPILKENVIRMRVFVIAESK